MHLDCSALTGISDPSLFPSLPHLLKCSSQSEPFNTYADLVTSLLKTLQLLLFSLKVRGKSLEGLTRALKNELPAHPLLLLPISQTTCLPMSIPLAVPQTHPAHTTLALCLLCHGLLLSAWLTASLPSNLCSSISLLSEDFLENAI